MYWNNMIVNTLHQDRIKEAARYRLTVDQMEAHPEATITYNPALAWVGRRIKDFGTRIVEIAGQPEQSLN